MTLAKAIEASNEALTAVFEKGCSPLTHEKVGKAIRLLPKNPLTKEELISLIETNLGINIESALVREVVAERIIRALKSVNALYIEEGK